MCQMDAAQCLYPKMQSPERSSSVTFSEDWWLQLEQRLVVMLEGIGYVFIRFSIFLNYFWFGALKIAGVSPAADLISKMFHKMPLLPLVFDKEFFCRHVIGISECLIGLVFLLSLMPRLRLRATRAALLLGLGHMMTVSFGPFLLLPGEVWQADVPYALTMEGQYIVKNLILTAGILTMASDLRAPAATFESRGCDLGSNGTFYSSA